MLALWISLIIIAVVVVLIIIYLWSVYMWGYHEKGEKLTEDDSKLFSEDNKPIILEGPHDRAIMFIHGFPTTPYMYRDAAPYAFKHSYDVYAPLIPTFGADWHDFERTNFSSWFIYIDEYYLKLRKKYKRLYVVGVSMGGAMTLKLAERHSGGESTMDGIAVLSAPVVENSLIRDKIVTSPAFYFARIIKCFTPSLGAKAVTSWPGDNDGGERWHGYRGAFPAAGFSLVFNLKEIRRDLYKIKVPMMSIHDETDRTVPFRNQSIIMSETSTDSIFLHTRMSDDSINTHHSLLMYDSTWKRLMDLILAFFEGERSMISSEMLTFDN